MAFCNTVGGQDELVFDGHSVIMDPNGKVMARGRQFEEDLVIVDIDPKEASRPHPHKPTSQRYKSIETNQVTIVSTKTTSATKSQLPHQPQSELLEPEAEVYRALVLGTADYFRKNGFKKAVLGLSGGIDSAL